VRRVFGLPGQVWSDSGEALCLEAGVSEFRRLKVEIQNVREEMALLAKRPPQASIAKPRSLPCGLKIRPRWAAGSGPEPSQSLAPLPAE